MPLLISITRAWDNSFISDDQNIWLSDSQNVWSGGRSIYRVSNEDQALENFWDGNVMDFTPISFKLSEVHGGYCKMGFGSMSLSNDVFDSPEDWPPPRTFSVKVEYTPDTEANAEILFAGTAFRSKWDRESITYDLYGDDYAVDLLEELEDYNGDTVPMPRAFGQIQHQACLRLPDVSGAPTYHKGYVAGTKGVDWHVYDDGVSIDANVTDNGDGTFSLSASPVGEVTISGTGTLESVDDIFTWACETARLNLTYDGSLVRDVSLACWITSQQTLLSFLDRIAAFTLNLFFIRAWHLVAVGMDTANGSGSLTEYDFFPSDYADPPPVATLKTQWTERQAVEETIGKYIKDVSREKTVKSDYYFGEARTVDTFSTMSTAANAGFLTAIIEKMNTPRARLSVPLASGLPEPGKELTFVDESLIRPVTWTIKARDLTYDFDSETVVIEGEGTVR